MLKNGRCCQAMVFMTLHQRQLPDSFRHLTLWKLHTTFVVHKKSLLKSIAIMLSWVCSSNGRVPGCHLCPDRKSLHTCSMVERSYLNDKCRFNSCGVTTAFSTCTRCECNSHREGIGSIPIRSTNTNL